ncbi:hypothetical protein [Maribacter halichondriae]|uniref:hypothetical protein n=1 Tax=Maribacter halichondriae TaxID=2980554 RepID=UPI00235A1F96|nr:hypothetical protein [Maribacter sp. Hal144]
MLRKIVDYKKLDHELAALLIETYPDGYGDDDIIAFKNLQGEIVEAVELRTNDIVYLVKISKSLANFISNFEDNIEKELEIEDEVKTDPILEEVDSNGMEYDMSSESDLEEELDLD